MVGNVQQFVYVFGKDCLKLSLHEGSFSEDVFLMTFCRQVEGLLRDAEQCRSQS